jgi:diguanylate cyclase (GGDEF)-like protein
LIRETDARIVVEASGGSHLLTDGDRIHIGNSVLKFSHQDEIKASFYEQLHHLVNRDHLTEPYSKDRFDREFEHHLKTMADEGSSLSVLMADVDSLNEVSDAHGHLLGEIGRFFGSLHEGEGRSAARFGGDEYRSILPDVPKQEAVEVAKEIRRRAEAHAFEREGATSRTTISIGVLPRRREKPPGVDPRGRRGTLQVQGRRRQHGERVRARFGLRLSATLRLRLAFGFSLGWWAR